MKNSQFIQEKIYDLFILYSDFNLIIKKLV